MTERIWHSGPPPHVGWWNASLYPNYATGIWRWWDGNKWSDCAVGDYSIDEVQCAASKPDRWNLDIWWTDYWPENARVPRIKP